MRRPPFRKVKFVFWGIPRIGKVVDRGSWIRHNLIITCKVCMKLVNVSVGGIYVPKNIGDAEGLVNAVLNGEPVLGRVLTSRTDDHELIRAEVLRKVSIADHDIIIALLKNLILDNGNKCLQRIIFKDHVPNITNINVLNTTKNIKTVVVKVPAGTTAIMRFDYKYKNTVLTREEENIGEYAKSRLPPPASSSSGA